jgi:cytochrome c nitrite reductase small subunit
MAAKYATKATNGYHHSMAFTSGNFPEVIRARPESLEVVEGQCRHCHADLVDFMTGGGEVSCLRCHVSVGHLR